MDKSPKGGIESRRESQTKRENKHGVRLFRTYPHSSSLQRGVTTAGFACQTPLFSLSIRQTIRLAQRATMD
jgi:hypothetical protein